MNEEVNLMDILRVSHKELQHSNFLSWLFNPTESHNLGDFALKEFIKIYFKEINWWDGAPNMKISFLELTLFDVLQMRILYRWTPSCQLLYKAVMVIAD